MAFLDVERKLLGQLAQHNEWDHPVMARDLFEILGLSGQLKQRIATMIEYKKPSSKRTTDEVTALRHHILLLVKRGLRLVESRIMPYADQGQFGRTLQVYSVKLRATFYHVLCRFHNQAPPASPTLSQPALTPHKTSQSKDKPKSPTTHLAPPSPEVTSSTTTTNISFLSNPWALPLARPPPTDTQQFLTSFSANLQRLSPYTATQHSSFLLPAHNYIPRTNLLFLSALSLSNTAQLSKSSPLRLAIVLEYVEFLIGCCGEEGEEKGRSLARQSVREVYGEREGMEDAEFEDAKGLVGVLEGLMGVGEVEGRDETM